MMTIEELNRIKERTLARQHPASDKTVVRIAVCMATNGLATGAQAVMDAIKDEVSDLGSDEDGARNSIEIQVVPIGCLGLCQLDLLVDVYKPGEERVTYVKMTPDKIRRVIHEHILGGRIVSDYTIHIANDLILNDYTVLER